jgi:hypothetical protein
MTLLSIPDGVGIVQCHSKIIARVGECDRGSVSRRPELAHQIHIGAVYAIRAQVFFGKRS